MHGKDKVFSIVAILAAIFVLFVATMDPQASFIIAVIALLGLGVYKFLNNE